MEKSVSDTAHMARMDAKYRAVRHIYDFTRKAFLVGRDKAIATLGPLDNRLVLEMGCGTGRNIIAMAQRFPGARFIGVDISAEMLKSAQASIAKAGLEARVEFIHAQAADYFKSVVPASFDKILMSYTLSMMPDWREVLPLGVSALAKGGQLSIVDFGDFGALPKGLDRLAIRTLGYFDAPPLVGLPQAVEELAGTQPDLRVTIETGRFGFSRQVGIFKAG